MLACVLCVYVLVRLLCVHDVSVSYDQLESLLQRFSSVAQQSGGHVTIEQFSQLLELPISDPMRDMFSLYDRVSSQRSAAR